MNGENLPYADMDAVPFTPITSEWGDGIADNILALAAGTGFDPGAISDPDTLGQNVVKNEHLFEGAGEPGGEWDSWTPTANNLSGTLTFAKYKRVGNTIHFRIRYAVSSVSGGPSFTAPVSAHADYAGGSSTLGPVGNAIYYDANGSWYLGFCYFQNSTTVFTLTAINAAGAYGAIAGVNTTVPHTWASGDAISLRGSYEAA